MKKQRVQALELGGVNKNTFFKSLYVSGFYVIKDGKKYLMYAKKMADACANASRITKETDSLINEREYVVAADDKQGNQLRRPFWWYGRVYLIDDNTTDTIPPIRERKLFE